jgi:putative membrane protein
VNPAPADTAPRDRADTRWHRLHPLSPVVRAGRLGAGLLAVLAISFATGGSGGGFANRIPELVVIAVAVLAAAVQWLVTRWRLDGDTLRIETGLLRRDSRQLPVSRIQAVDVVRPFLARVLGVSELRVRLAGSSHADGRLAYLPEQEAADLRATLLAMHHGLAPATPEPAERPVAIVPAGRLIASLALSPATIFFVLAVAALIAAHAAHAVSVALGGTLLGYVFALALVGWRRLSAQFGFTVAESPDGIRIRRGLLGTVAETIPYRRVQAVRLVQPLLWRPFGWCRLEVHVAGTPGREEGPRSGDVRQALLPVGDAALAMHLVHVVFGTALPNASRPPGRARWKAPLSYHFLAAGHDNSMAVAVTGRVRRTTVWVPLEKLQSVRLVQGPLQRRLSLATVHVDAAGKRTHAVFRDRPADDAHQLTDALAALSRTARTQHR